MITLYTTNLIIRDHIQSDLETHHALFSNQDVMFYLPDIMTHSFEESRENLETAIKGQNESDRIFWFFRIEDRKTGRHIGEIGYTVTGEVDSEGKHGKAGHMGYFMHREFWGKGIMTQAVHEVLRFAFMDNDVVYMRTGCLAENKGSERVMQKSGFMKDATFNETVMHDNRPKQRVEYYMTPSLFAAKNSRLS